MEIPPPPSDAEFESDADIHTRREMLGRFLVASAPLWLPPSVRSALSGKGSLDKIIGALENPTHMNPMLNTVFFSPDAHNTQETKNFVKHGGAKGVVLWPPKWADLEPKPGEWNDTLWERYDKDFAAAQTVADRVYVSVWSEYPKHALIAKKHAPKHRGRDSGFARFMEVLLEHDRQKKHNVAGYMPLNEPNITFIDDKRKEEHTADLIVTADQVSYDFGYDGTLWIPATADIADNHGVDFTTGVIKNLIERGFKPSSRMGIATHHYEDVLKGVFKTVQGHIELLKDWVGEERELLLSEGGYPFETVQVDKAHAASGPGVYKYKQPVDAQEALQAKNIVNHYLLSLATHKVKGWANYTYRDVLLGEFKSGFKRIDGTPRQILKYWKRLHQKHA